MSHGVKPAHLTLTPHHLYYLLSRIEELDIAIGPMNVRLQDINSDPSPANYVSFLQSRNARLAHSDNDSIHSVSSVRSVMSSISTLWSSIGLSSHSKNEKAKVAVESDLKYLYSAFTKLPSLRFAPDHRARLIRGYEEFPLDTAVPLFAFKNLQQLEIIDMDFRHLYGWDRLADQLCLLTVKRANLDDPTDLITNIVLDDAEKRRRRSNKGTQSSPTLSWTVPSTPRGENRRVHSDPTSPVDESPKNNDLADYGSFRDKKDVMLVGSCSPKRPTPSRPASSYRHMRTYSARVKRSGSSSSNCSDYSLMPYRSENGSNLLGLNVLPSSKWQRLKYLSLADNSLTSLSSKSLVPLAGSLRSLSLSSNLFIEIPDSLATLSRLTSLDLSNCMIESLHSLLRNPLPAILTLKLKSNRLQSLAGIERLLSLENLNIQDNQIRDTMEIARLTGMPNFRRLYVKHNPFTKRMNNYRITIFNLFRNTSGYVEDVIIDEQGPTYSERKYLVERVPEVEHPRILGNSQSEKTPKVVQSSTESRVLEAEESHQAKNRDLEFATRGSLPRKGARRRIVDLARDENVSLNPERTVPEIGLSHDIPTASNHTSTSTSIAPGHRPAMDIQSVILSAGTNLLPDERNLDANSVDYRARVEALRREFGNSWISALGGQGRHHPDELPVPRSLNEAPVLNRANSHPITIGGSDL